MTPPAFPDADPAQTGFQYLEDLATAYWYSEVLFTALNLELFDHLQKGDGQVVLLAHEAGCDPEALKRLLTALARLELVGEYAGQWFNRQVASTFLVSTSPTYLGDFLLYRQYMKAGWEKLFNRVSTRSMPVVDPSTFQENYTLRNFLYVQAMDALARVKAGEILSLLSETQWQPPVLDIGGGAGALCRAIVLSRPDCSGVLFDLPEVIRAARQLYPSKDDWRFIQAIEGDFRTHTFTSDHKFGLILLGNFLHAYGEQDARGLLKKALSLLSPHGLVIIHDYFPDMGQATAQKGALYDLNMMLNTYEGACHLSEKVIHWLKEEGLVAIWRSELSSDSALIVAGGPEAPLQSRRLDPWPLAARSLGFRRAVALRAEDVIVGAWVRLKCRNGCSNYGRNLQCPPHSLRPAEMSKLLKSYRRGILVEDAPPGKAFHDKLLALERKAFLGGYHKAMVFGAGPCQVCQVCSIDGPCRHPEKARPSMEAVGVDVYETVRQAGLVIDPVLKKGDYVKYFGLLLLE